jgi:serine/threonine protein phosphatase PrpC
MVRRFVFILFILAFFEASLRFRISNIEEGAFDPLLKSKKQRKKMGEDGHCTTPYTLAVADGVSSTEFTSFYLANILSLSISERLLSLSKDSLDLEKEKSEIVSEMQKEINRYEFKVIEKVKFLENDREVLADEFSLNSMDVSTTLVACHIIEDQGKNTNLRIFQKGDSLISIFRSIKSRKSADSYVYLPVYFSEDHSYEFNTPYQFMTMLDKKRTSNDENNSKNENNSNDNLYLETGIREGDIVLVGSDGIYDNVHISFITYLINFISEEILKKTSSPDIQEKVKELSKRYAEIFIEKPQEKMIKIEKKAENKVKSFKRRPVQKKTGFSFWKWFCLADESFDEISPRDIISIKEESITEKEDSMNSDDEDLEIYVDQDEKEGEVIYSETRGFFDCPERAMTNQPYHWETEEAFLSLCVKRSIEKEFGFSNERVIMLQSMYSTKIFTDSLLVAAIELSKTKNYPSLLYLKGLDQRRPRELPRKGKRDDITVLVGLVEKDNDSSDLKLKSKDFLSKIIESKREIMYKELSLDVESFLINYNNESYIVPMPEEKKESIARLII